MHPFAAQNTYGGPEGLQRLVDAAHRTGLAVILDVVYNHLGPEGNYFGNFAPYFTDCYHTPWGRALNYDGPQSDPVRKIVLDNADMWIRDFHLDGLRLDAVQTIFDTSALHILAELQQTVQQIAQDQRRHVTVIGETNQNDIRLVAPAADGGYGLDGIWADDFHHGMHALLTGERDGHYQAYGEAEHLAKSLRDAFVYDGRYSPFHHRRHGNRAGDTPREKFVFCVQNHDQIGNRAHGGPPGGIAVGCTTSRVAAALLLLAPTTPLLFMGEEYGETRPFPFFCLFSNPELVAAVRRGRKAELASVKFVWQHEPPDPPGEQTFNEARLSWNWASDPRRAGLRALYKDLLWARQAWFGAKPCDVTLAEILVAEGDAPCLWFERGGSQPVQIYANLSERKIEAPRQPAADTRLLLSTADTAYGSAREARKSNAVLLPYECVVWGPADLQSARLLSATDRILENSRESNRWCVARFCGSDAPGRGTLPARCWHDVVDGNGVDDVQSCRELPAGVQHHLLRVEGTHSAGEQHLARGKIDLDFKVMSRGRHRRVAVPSESEIVKLALGTPCLR